MRGWPRIGRRSIRQYIVRQLLILIPSLLGISALLFFVLASAPGDPFEELATNPNVPAEVRMALRAKFGLDDPVYLRYFHWLFSMLQGDWGFSFVSRVDVDKLILQRLPTTLYVIGSAQILALLVAIPVGVVAGTRAYQSDFSSIHSDSARCKICSTCRPMEAGTGLRPASTS